MPSTKPRKGAVDSARPGICDVEVRDTFVSGYFCKITPAGRKALVLAYRPPSGGRRRPSFGSYGRIRRTAKPSSKVAPA